MYPLSRPEKLQKSFFFQAMAAVLFGNLFPRWLLRSLVTHRWNNAEMLPTAAAAGWEATAVRRIPQIDGIYRGSNDET